MEMSMDHLQADTDKETLNYLEQNLSQWQRKKLIDTWDRSRRSAVRSK
jgi:hypothetical protein